MAVGPERCPCGGATYDGCCGRLHRGERSAATAEELMRSRYSAFAVRDEAYLLATWHRSSRPSRVEVDGGERWIRLDVLGTSEGNLLDEQGIVEFEAHALIDGESEVHRERSLFRRDGGRWCYVVGLPAG